MIEKRKTRYCAVVDNNVIERLEIPMGEVRKTKKWFAECLDLPVDQIKMERNPNEPE